MSFILYPAIDVREGRVVRLQQGDFARETCYDASPVASLRRYAALGATWAHLVDLDAARFGGYTLAPVLQALRETGLQIQTGGGVRCEADIERLMEAGAARVVIGSVAVADPKLVAKWLSRFGSDRLTVALDARSVAGGEWYPAMHGWTLTGDRTLSDLVTFYSSNGLRHLLCTDIACDGTLGGPNFALYGELRAWAPDLELQASGGVRELADLSRLRALGCGGAVVGKALLEGQVSLQAALTC